MLLKQFSLACLSHYSYLAADKASGDACVVDPQRDIDLYLEEARAQNLKIKHIVLTHNHADFASGHLELKEATGATIYMGQASLAEFEFKRLKDGDTITLGSIELKILETPGHTPDSISVLVIDTSKDPKVPQAVLTGDTLFLGDVGRPDLLTSKGISAHDLAGLLFDSIHNKLAKLPDETIVYPAHGAGSSCGKNLSSDSHSTMAVQKLTNWAFKTKDKQDFVNEVTNQSCAPKYFAHTANYNQKEHHTLTKHLDTKLSPLDLNAGLKLQQQGAQLLDVRDANAFAQKHIAGSINIGLSGRYASWCGAVLSPDQPIVIIANTGEAKEAALRLGRIGFDNVVGYLDGGLSDTIENTQSSKRLSAKQLKELLQSQEDNLVLDVRTPDEWNKGHIEGAIHVPLLELNERIAEVPHKPLVVVCAGGYRSSIAASMLRQRGYSEITDLIGGMGAWEK